MLFAFSSLIAGTITRIGRAEIDAQAGGETIEPNLGPSIYQSDEIGEEGEGIMLDEDGNVFRIHPI